MKYIITERQYRLLTEGNILSEGRKEELVDKYTNKFKEYPSVITTVLNNDFIKKTNYKYGDFLLKELHPVSSDEEIDEAIELIDNFDKYQKNLDKKDINQYHDLEELDHVLNLHLISKKPKSHVEKIYEDNRFVVIIPKNQEAACKYGSNTKWCVTSKDSGHFKTYTSGDQLLYFIIDKKNSTDTEFSKVAVHVTNSRVFVYYDSQDKHLTDKEIRLLNYAIPDAIKAINDDSSKKTLSKDFSLFRVFTDEFYDDISIDYEITGSNNSLFLKLFGFESEEVSHAKATLDILLDKNNSDKPFLIDKYVLYITYSQLSDKTLGVMVDFWGSEEYIYNFIDLELSGEKITYYPIKFGNTEKDTAEKVRKIILDEVVALIVKKNINFNFFNKKINFFIKN